MSGVYTRPAWESDEPWLLDALEDAGIEIPRFQSRDFVISVNEQSDERIGFGRLLEHTEEYSEITNLFSSEKKKESNKKVAEELIKMARREDFELVYYAGEGVLSADELHALGFEKSENPPYLKGGGPAFVRDPDYPDESDSEVEQLKEEFGMEDASTKYSTN